MVDYLIKYFLYLILQTRKKDKRRWFLSHHLPSHHLTIYHLILSNQDCKIYFSSYHLTNDLWNKMRWDGWWLINNICLMNYHVMISSHLPSTISLNLFCILHPISSNVSNKTQNHTSNTDKWDGKWDEKLSKNIYSSTISSTISLSCDCSHHLYKLIQSS